MTNEHFDRHEVTTNGSKLPQKSMDNTLLILAGRNEGDMTVEKYEITNDITAQQLQRLPELPFEVSIEVLSDGRRILITGDKTSVGGVSNDELGGEYIVAGLHSHPNKINFYTPSFPDIRGAGETYNKSLTPPENFLVTSEGITQYGPPKTNPLTNETVAPDTSENLLYEMVELRVQELGVPTVWNLPAGESSRIERELVSRSGAIISKTEWDNTQGIAIIVNKFNP